MSKDKGKVLTRGKQAIVVETEKMGFREVEVHEPKGKEVVVQITISGVCHSDVHAFEHSSVYAMFPFPQAPGHEIMGKVYAKGPDAKGVEVGESVLVYPWIKCGKCERCEKGNDNWCVSPVSNIIGGAGNGQGGYAEFVTVEDKFCVNADGVDPELAVILPCCGLTSYNAVKQSQISEQSTSDGVLAIIGTGGLGMMGIQWAKELTNQTVVAIDIRDEALETALEYGADFAINCVKTPNVRAEINKLKIKNKTVEAIIDFVNNTKTHQLGQTLMQVGTNFVIVGIHGGEIKLNLTLFPLRGARYSGIFVGSLNELREEIELCRTGRIRSIVTKRRPLSEIQQALEDLQQGKIRGRSIVTVSKL